MIRRILHWLSILLLLWVIDRRLFTADWTNPMTWTSALVSVAQLNEQIRDNLSFLFAPNVDLVTMNEADKTTTSTTFVDVDAAGDPDLSLSIETFGEDVVAEFWGMIQVDLSGAGTRGFYLDVAVDGVRHGTDDGITGGVYATASITNGFQHMIGFRRRIPGLASGVHTFTLQWRVSASAGTATATLYCGAGASPDIHPQFWVTKG